MSAFAYPPPALFGDYARAGIGLAIVGAPLVWADPAPLVTAALAAGVATFAAFAARTARLHLLRIDVDGDGVRWAGLRRRRIRWRELRGVRLAYFSTRRDHGDGWLQLTLIGEGVRLRVDSRIDGFAVLARRAVSAADANGLALDATTVVNLDVLGGGAPGMRPVEGLR